MGSNIDVCFCIDLAAWKRLCQGSSVPECTAVQSLRRLVSMPVLPPTACAIECSSEDTSVVESISYSISDGQFSIGLDDLDCYSDEEFDSARARLLAAGWVQTN